MIVAGLKYTDLISQKNMNIFAISSYMILNNGNN